MLTDETEFELQLVVFLTGSPRLAVVVEVGVAARQLIREVFAGEGAVAVAVPRCHLHVLGHLLSVSICLLSVGVVVENE